MRDKTTNDKPVWKDPDVQVVIGIFVMMNSLFVLIILVLVAYSFEFQMASRILPYFVIPWVTGVVGLGIMLWGLR